MNSKMFLILVVGTGLFLQGCETVKGAANGVHKDFQNTANNLSGENNPVKKADDWIKKNMW